MSSMNELKINGVICDDEKTIAKYVSNFYSKLYSKENLDENKMDMYCLNIDNNITKISEEFVLKVIDSLKDNKAPGNDGLIGEFYKHFKESLAPFLVQVFEEAITKGKLPPTLQQGLIKLIQNQKRIN